MKDSLATFFFESNSIIYIFLYLLEDKEKEEINSPLVKPKKKKKFSVRSAILSLRNKLGLKSKNIDRPILFHIMQRR